mmetsp:Transcript_19372/g.49760  ORF Transcript_19372/g.49760 Transcript_19372/m.49760 type:complete len:225 (+) Transcript_19372:776-1450(+)
MGGAGPRPDGLLKLLDAAQRVPHRRGQSLRRGIRPWARARRQRALPRRGGPVSGVRSLRGHCLRGQPLRPRRAQLVEASRHLHQVLRQRVAPLQLRLAQRHLVAHRPQLARHHRRRRAARRLRLFLVRPPLHHRAQEGRALRQPHQPHRSQRAHHQHESAIGLPLGQAHLHHGAHSLTARVVAWHQRGGRARRAGPVVRVQRLQRQLPRARRDGGASREVHVAQ